MSKKQYKPTKPKVDNKIKQAAKSMRDPFFEVIARVYGVPTNGIDAIGNQPYLNKDGRLYLLNELRTGKQAVRAIRTDFIRTSTTIIEPAIVKKIIVFKDDTEIEAIGEASQDNVETSSVKKTLNMVAETRALNRAIWTAIAADVMKRVEDNLATLEISTEDRVRIMEAGRVSYEEMERPQETKVAQSTATMYEATARRIDEITKDEDALRRALNKVESLPLNAEEKVLIKEKINNALNTLLGKKKDNELPVIQTEEVEEKQKEKKKAKKKAKKIK